MEVEYGDTLQPLFDERHKMGKIRGNNDGPNGRNESYRVGNRLHVPRLRMVQEVKRGLHPGNHVIKVRGREYVRDDPDSSTKDNVNQ